MLLTDGAIVGSNDNHKITGVMIVSSCKIISVLLNAITLRGFLVLKVTYATYHLIQTFEVSE
jgi:hypothetical protein